MSQLATLHIDKQAHKFSAAHFTIFSETERERLHGHNYGVSARIVAEMGENGFSADYNVYKRCLQKLCDAHDEYMLLPSESPWLAVEELEGEYLATFNGKTLRFPVDETLLLAPRQRDGRGACSLSVAAGPGTDRTRRAHRAGTLCDLRGRANEFGLLASVLNIFLRAGTFPSFPCHKGSC
jgi:hypothetical protein